MNILNLWQETRRYWDDFQTFRAAEKKYRVFLQEFAWITGLELESATEAECKAAAQDISDDVEYQHWLCAALRARTHRGKTTLLAVIARAIARDGPQTKPPPPALILYGASEGILSRIPLYRFTTAGTHQGQVSASGTFSRAEVVHPELGRYIVPLNLQTGILVFGDILHILPFSIE